MESNVLGHGIIDYIVIFVFALYSFYVGMNKQYKIIYILPAALTFYFFVNWGTLLTPIKIVPFFFLMGSLFKGNFNSYISYLFENSWIRLFIIVLFVSLVIGLLFSMFFDIDNYRGYPIMKRLFIQLTSYVNCALIYVIMRNILTDERIIYEFYRAYIITTTILCIYGFYQVLAVELNLPYRGVVYSEGKQLGVYMGDTFRINSLTNEPKRYSYMVFMTVVLLLEISSEKLRISKHVWIFLIVIHFINAYLTLSTSFFFAITIFVVAILLLSSHFRQLIPIRKKIVVGVVIVSVIALFNMDKVRTLYENRIEEQMTQVDGTNENYIRLEVFGFELLGEKPLLNLSGVGLGNYNFILQKEKGVGITGRATLASLNSGVLTYIFDFGIIGVFLLFVSPIFFVVRQIKYKKLEGGLSFLFIIICSLFLNTTFFLFAFMGVCHCCLSLEINPNNSKSTFQFGKISDRKHVVVKANK